MIRTLQEAKESRMKELMDKIEPSETFITDDSETSGNSCCFPLYRTLFPKQPLSNEELEWLVEDDEEQNR